MRSRFLPRAALCLFALAFAGQAHATDDAEPVALTVLLDWFVNPDHAPLIVAEQQGWFEQAGLEVTFVEPADPSLPPKLVAAGRADLAITYQPQLHVQADAGLPLVRIATLVATPLNALVVLADGPIRTIADLDGKRVGYSVGGFEDALLGTMLESHGLTLDAVELINVNFSLSPSLLSGQVDAVIGAFRNFELNQMDIEGRPGRAFFPEEEGVPAYDELIVVAHRDRLAEGPDAAALNAFTGVLERAAAFIVNRPEQAWKVFAASDADGLDNELNRRAWRDTVPRFALRPAALDGARYERFAGFMRARGLIDAPPALDTYARQLPGPPR